MISHRFRLELWWLCFVALAYIAYTVWFSLWLSSDGYLRWLAEIGFIIASLIVIWKDGILGTAQKWAGIISWSGIKFFVVFCITMIVMFLDTRGLISQSDWVKTEVENMALLLIKSLVDIFFFFALYIVWLPVMRLFTRR